MDLSLSVGDDGTSCVVRARGAGLGGHRGVVRLLGSPERSQRVVWDGDAADFSFNGAYSSAIFTDEHGVESRLTVAAPSAPTEGVGEEPPPAPPAPPPVTKKPARPATPTRKRI